MTVESATYINELDATYPAAGDDIDEGDDHLRLIKSAIKASFPNINGAVGASDEDLAAMGDGYASITLGGGVSHGNPGFLRRGVDGLCCMSLYLSGAPTTGATIATLPAGYRPSQTLYFVPCHIYDSTPAAQLCFVHIDTAGVISKVDDLGATLPAAATISIIASFPTR